VPPKSKWKWFRLPTRMTRNRRSLFHHSTIVARTKSGRKNHFTRLNFSSYTNHQCIIICIVLLEKKRSWIRLRRIDNNKEFRCNCRQNPSLEAPPHHWGKSRPTAYPGKYNRLQLNTGQTAYHHFKFFFRSGFFSTEKLSAPTTMQLAQTALIRTPRHTRTKQNGMCTGGS
jgi:hypothetical protein